MTKRTIEIEDDPGFQRKEWVAQRIGIGVLALFLLAAVLGFTGNGGLFSHGEVGDESGVLRVEYDRTVRRGATSTITIHLNSATPGSRSFWISTEYLSDVIVESVSPDPEAVVAESHRYVYTVKVAAADIMVRVRVRPTRVGWLDAQVGIVNGPSVHFRQTSLF